MKSGTQQLLAQAIEAEIAIFPESHKPAEGKSPVARNGYLPERTIQTGLGDIPVKIPKTWDRSVPV